MSATVEQTRYRVGSRSLHITQQGDLGWVCWLNVEDIDFSGLMLASGATRQDAVSEACRVLQTCIDVLERPPMSICWLCGGKGYTYEEYVFRVACKVCNGTGRLG